MTIKDFNSLHIGQILYFEGKEKIIKTLHENENGSQQIVFFDGTFKPRYEYWSKICLWCSLTKPLRKVRYWKWVLFVEGEPAKTTLCYRDDRGYGTNRTLPNDIVWEDTKKMKLENEFIDMLEE